MFCLPLEDGTPAPAGKYRQGVKMFPSAILRTLIFGAVFFTGACTNRPVSSYSTGEGEREIDNRRRTGECTYYESCQEKCDEIFRLREDREKCEEFSVEDVDKLKFVFEVLEDFDRESAGDLDLKDVEFLLNISSEPLEKAVERMSGEEREDFLAWLAWDSKAAGLVVEAEREFKILKELLGIVENDIIAAVNNPIAREGAFAEIALKRRNFTALAWAHDFFEKNCEKSSFLEICLFTRYYCHFSLSSDTLERKFLDYSFFTEMLDKILRDHRPDNPPRWWTRATRVRDLSSWQNHPHDVCAEDLY